MEEKLVLAVLQTFVDITCHIVHDGQLKELSPFVDGHGLDLFFLLEGPDANQTEEITLDDVHEYLLGYLNRMDNMAAMPMAKG